MPTTRQQARDAERRTAAAAIQRRMHPVDNPAMLAETLRAFDADKCDANAHIGHDLCRWAKSLQHIMYAANFAADRLTEAMDPSRQEAGMASLRRFCRRKSDAPLPAFDHEIVRSYNEMTSDVEELVSSVKVWCIDLQECQDGCQGMTRSGRFACRNRPQPGNSFCHTHLGQGDRCRFDRYDPRILPESNLPDCSGVCSNGQVVCQDHTSCLTNVQSEVEQITFLLKREFFSIVDATADFALSPPSSPRGPLDDLFEIQAQGPAEVQDEVDEEPEEDPNEDSDEVEDDGDHFDRWQERQEEELDRPVPAPPLELITTPLVGPLAADERCVLCLEAMSKTGSGDEKVCKLKVCGHYHHEACLLHWLRKARAQDSCPLCRACVIPDEDVFMEE